MFLLIQYKFFIIQYSGLFSSSVMEYGVLRSEKNRTHEPTFTEMIEKAIKILSKNPKGFFLLAEGTTTSFFYYFVLLLFLY